MVLSQGVWADTVNEVDELSTPEAMCPDGQVVYYRTNGPQCAPRFDDAHAPCSTALDCDGTCLVDADGQGICSAGPLDFGCTDFLTEDGMVGTICIE